MCELLSHVHSMEFIAGLLASLTLFTKSTVKASVCMFSVN